MTELRARQPLAELPGAVARRRMRERLLAWYRAARRDLPWRRTRDPYAILVSEAMLQQTRVEAVLGAYARFLARFPTAEALASASEQDVLAAWSGLGYYRRARALQAAAAEIVARRGFPRTRAALEALPGVGRYTAGAVLSIAFDEPAALVDGNVERVLSRHFALDAEAGSPPLVRACWEIAEACVPRTGAGDWNQALMELGATVCTPREPRCDACPLARSCAARASGRAAELPRKKARRAPVDVELVLLLAERGGRALLEQRPSVGRMAGLWQLPTLEIERAGRAPLLFPARFPDGVGPTPDARARVVCELGHTITHHRIRARVLRASAPLRLPDPPFRWVERAAAGDLALTGMARKALRAIERARP